MAHLPRIGIDYTPAYEQGGGIGRYVRELVAALVAQRDLYDYRLFVAGAAFPFTAPFQASRVSWSPITVTPPWLARIWHRLRLPLVVEAFTGKLDLFHATDFVLPPTLSQTVTLLTVHDLSFVRVPDSAFPALKRYLDQVVPRSVMRADHILADSVATKVDLVDLYGVVPEKVTVLLSGVNQSFARATDPVFLMAMRNKYGLGSWPYLFSVGTVQPRKNYARVIQALALLHKRGFDLHLVIAGGKGWLDDPIYATVHEQKMQDFVHFIGFADDADLPALYSAASCFVFPSLYEGFGLPVLEAMRCGTPVITSNVSSLPEVAGDAALTVDPYDVEAIADALERIVSSPSLCETLVSRGYERARQFTWEASAQHLLDIYAQLLA